MREWTAVAMEELAMEMTVKAAAMEERARQRRRGRPTAAAAAGRPRFLIKFFFRRAEAKL